MTSPPRRASILLDIETESHERTQNLVKLIVFIVALGLLAFCQTMLQLGSFGVLVTALLAAGSIMGGGMAVLLFLGFIVGLY